jgi:hypothetical protein
MRGLNYLICATNISVDNMQMAQGNWQNGSIMVVTLSFYL